MTSPSDLGDLRAKAAEALAAVDPLVGTRKIRAIKILRDGTGLGLKECIPLIDWAIEQGDKAPVVQPAADVAAIRRAVAMEIGARIDEVLRRTEGMPPDRAFANACIGIGFIIGDYTKTEG